MLGGGGFPLKDHFMSSHYGGLLACKWQRYDKQYELLLTERIINERPTETGNRRHAVTYYNGIFSIDIRVYNMIIKMD